MVRKTKKSFLLGRMSVWVMESIYIVTGAVIAAFGLQFFLIPNKLIDGGTVGLSTLIAEVSGNKDDLPKIIVFLTLPFVFLAYRTLGKHFVIKTIAAISSFSLALHMMNDIKSFSGDVLEVVVFGGLCIGIGVGTIIKSGGCLDGTEILAIILSKRTGFTVGQIILFFNMIIFTVAGFVYDDWNSALRSLMMYTVAYKVIDAVIAGFDEVKSVTIISNKSQLIANVIIHEMGVGVTIINGRGGFSGDNKEILYIIIERLQISELKNVVQRIDPSAFIAIENIHEIVSGNDGGPVLGSHKRKKQNH